MKYAVILADPPWSYNSRAGGRKFRGGVGDKYPVLKTEEIAALPVGNLTEDRAVLFMWATWPMLREALWVIDAWGFEYKTIGFTWVKTNRLDKKPFFGVGFYTRSNSEPCLLATRGRVLHPRDHTVSSLVISPRRKHSKKPDEVRTRIERLYPDLPKLELFATPPRSPGWDAHGLELDGRRIQEVMACLT